MQFRAKLLNYFRSRDRGLVLALFAAVCLLYLPFLGNPFVFDDQYFFVGNVASEYGQSWFHFNLRWLPYATLGWTSMLFSNVATHTFHLGNLLLHATNVILLFYLLRQIMIAVVPEDDSYAMVLSCWFAAAIFALHPVMVYAVNYVVQRSILMATMFALLMQLAFLRGLLRGQARWLVLAVLAYFMAVFSKEHSRMMPAVLAMLMILLRGKIRASAGALWASWAAFVAIALFVLMLTKGLLGSPYEKMAASLFEQQGIAESTPVLHVLSVLTQAGLFFKYLLLWLLPNPAWMSIDMRVPFQSSLDAWQGWLGLSCFMLYGYFSVRLLLRGGRRGLYGFALLYPWILFMTEFSGIRVQEPFVLYRSYLWLPGMLLLLPLSLSCWPVKRIWLVAVLTLALLVPAALNRLWVFGDQYRLWSDAVLLLPDEHIAGADRIFYNMGQAAAARGKHDDAIADFKRVLAMSPQHAPVHFELGWQYVVSNRFDEALVEFDKTIELDPDQANAYYGKGLILKMRHQNKLAAEMMAKSCQLKNAMACLIVKGSVSQQE